MLKESQKMGLPLEQRVEIPPIKTTPRGNSYYSYSTNNLTLLYPTRFGNGLIGSSVRAHDAIEMIKDQYREEEFVPKVRDSKYAWLLRGFAHAIDYVAGIAKKELDKKRRKNLKAI